MVQMKLLHDILQLVQQLLHSLTNPMCVFPKEIHFFYFLFFLKNKFTVGYEQGHVKQSSHQEL